MQNFIEKLMRKQKQRIVFRRLAEEHVQGERLPALPIEPNKSYFQISLCEMFLRDQRELWRNFIPMGLAISDFYFGGESQSLPAIVGNRQLGEAEQYIKGTYIDFRNSLVAGPVPYTGRNVGLFVGLFRVEVRDLAAGLFRLLDEVMGNMVGAGLTRYLELARPLGQGLAELLGMKEMELRFGLRDEFSSRSGSPQQFRQGYLAYLNMPEEESAGDMLFVSEGRLHRQKGGRLRPVDDCDYCLVKIEHLPKRVDYANLSFYPLWTEVRKLLLAKETAQAEWKRLELLQQIADSPDLTEEDREGLIQHFELSFARLSRQEIPTTSATRGGKSRSAGGRGESTMDPGLHLQRTAFRAEKAGASKAAVGSLMAMSRNWQLVPGEKETEERTEAEAINCQLAALKKIRKKKKPRPRELADAIILSALHGD